MCVCVFPMLCAPVDNVSVLPQFPCWFPLTKDWEYYSLFLLSLWDFVDLASEMTVKPSFTALNYLFTASHAKSTCVDSCQSRSFTQGLRKKLLIKKGEGRGGSRGWVLHNVRNRSSQINLCLSVAENVSRENRNQVTHIFPPNIMAAVKACHHLVLLKSLLFASMAAFGDLHGDRVIVR